MSCMNKNYLLNSRTKFISLKMKKQKDLEILQRKEKEKEKYEKIPN